MKDTLPIASPCVEVCRIDEAAGYCSGCYRTLDEIASWRDCTPSERAAIMSQLDHRRAAFGKRKKA